MIEPSMAPSEEAIKRRCKSFEALAYQIGETISHKLAKDFAESYEKLASINKWQEWQIIQLLKEKNELSRM